jgi:RNA polymerase sigma-54 factor
MALAPRLELRQSQALVMTPQLQQAIKLLQLSNMELTEYVERELEQNPLLERDDEAPDEPGRNDEPAGDGDGAETAGDALDGVDVGPGGQDLDVDYDNLWNNDSAADGAMAAMPGDASAAAFAKWGGRGGGFDGAGRDLEQTLSDSESLRDHLVGQLNMDLDDAVDRLIGLHLIDMLDEAGYISGELASVADILACDTARVEATLARLQQFDPPGICARDLAECLALQLSDRDRLDPAMRALLDNLDLLAKRDVPALLRACGVDADDLADMVAEVRALDPKPALAFDHGVAQPVTPDIFMRPQPGQGWVIELNNDTLPRVLVNNHYFARVSRSARSKEDKRYLNEALQSANWLVKSLHQRANTILKVASEIVRQQDGFFAKGVRHLKPLVLRDIAHAIEMHESTVSRVTSNKYMATPRGIYELKYFFTAAIGSSVGGEAHSAESVRHRIKALTEEEPADNVLSDDKIVAVLRAESIDIARRTVAKYRESMSIPSSVQRRREKTRHL